MHRHPRGRAGDAWAFVGAVAGAAIAVSFYGVTLLLVEPDLTSGALVDRMAQAAWAEPPEVWILLSGAVAGFLLFGSVASSRLALDLLRGVGAGLKIFFGVGLGALFGVLAYVLFAMASQPGATFQQVLDSLGPAAADPANPLRAFLAAGGIAGLVVTFYAIGGPAVRRWARAGTGAVVGGLAGLVIFTVGYVMVNYPELPQSSAYLFRFAEAIYSLSPVEFLFVGMGSVVGLLMSSYSWRLYGVLTLIALLSVVMGYVAYAVSYTIPTVPPDQRAMSYVLFTAETLSLGMVLVYSFYSIDVATRKHWRRRPQDAEFSPYYMPKVCVQVPTYNEPPALVLDTLKRLTNLDYPVDRYLVMILDDSTRPECATPLREFATNHGTDCQIVYYHREDRRGYKAGALNHGLERTPDDVNLLAIVDSDYHVEPEFLRETVGYFVDPNLAWLQTPQDYRNRSESFLSEQYYLADAYFYRTILPSRNEENSIIFCGTMGLLRKQALVEVGGWGEKYITEDAELSLRLVTGGWNSLYVNKTYGRGLIPATFEAYKKQHYRWAFGGGKILRGHFFRMAFGRLTLRQRFDYFLGNFNWFEGIFILMISFAILAMGLGELFGRPFVSHHSTEILLIGLVPWFLLVDGLTRVHLVLRRTMNMSFGATVRILGMWFSVKFSDLFGALKALVGFNIPFLRTPKTSPDDYVRGMKALKRAVRITRFETSMCVILLLTGTALAVKTWNALEATGELVLPRLLLVVWLGYYSLVFMAAPYYAYRSYSTLVPKPETMALPLATPKVTA